MWFNNDGGSIILLPEELRNEWMGDAIGPSGQNHYNCAAVDDYGTIVEFEPNKFVLVIGESPDAVKALLDDHGRTLFLVAVDAIDKGVNDEQLLEICRGQKLERRRKHLGKMSAENGAFLLMHAACSGDEVKVVSGGDAYIMDAFHFILIGTAFNIYLSELRQDLLEGHLICVTSEHVSALRKKASVTSQL